MAYRGGDVLLSLEERYMLLKERLAHYLLLQVHVFLTSYGRSGVPLTFQKFVDKSAQIKVERVKGHRGDRAEALATDLAQHMGEAFASRYSIQKCQAGYSVLFDECVCITTILRNASAFELSKEDCRAIFCGSCMGGYRSAAEQLGLRFKGELNGNGCSMEFLTGL